MPRDALSNYTDAEHERAAKRVSQDIAEHGQRQPTRVIKHQPGRFIDIDLYADDGWPKPESDPEL